MAAKLSSEYLLEVGDIMENIEKEDGLCSTLFFNPDFPEMVKSRVHTCEPTLEMQQAPCTCHPFTRTTSLRNPHPTLHQLTFVMKHRWLAGLRPNYQVQLDAPMSEPFPKLKHDRQPPKLKYERHLIMDEMYQSALYKQ